MYMKKRVAIAVLVMLSMLVLPSFSLKAYAAPSINYKILNANVTIGDGGTAAISLIVNVTNIEGTPALYVDWILHPDSSVFNYDAVGAEAVYYDDQGNVYTVTPSLSKDAANDDIEVEVNIGSVASSSIILNLTIYLPVKPGIVNTAGITFQYVLGLTSGDTVETPQTGTINVIIVPEPPTIALELAARRISPGVPLVANITVSDGSGVENVSLRVIHEGNIVYERTWGSSETSNGTIFSTSIEINQTKAKGNYTVYVESCDILGNCANKTAMFTVTDVFSVPGDFASISDALASPSVGNNVTIMVTSLVNETSTIIVDKSVKIIGGSSGAIIQFSGTKYGFNITAGDVTIANITVKGASTSFVLCSIGNSLVSINAVGHRFLEVCDAKFNNTVLDSTLNNTAVAYFYARSANVTGDYIEAHLYEGDYTLKNAVISYLETAGSIIIARNSSIVELRDLGNSRIEIYDSQLAAYIGSNSSSIAVFRGLKVTVLYGGQPLAGAMVTVRGALLDEPLVGVTDATGSIIFNIPVARGTRSIEEQSYNVTVVAEYKGLVANTTVDLNLTNVAMLELPLPSFQASVVDIFGNNVAVVEPGQLLDVNATYDLKGFTGSANITVTLIKDGETMSIVNVPLKMLRGYVETVVMVPWKPGSYSVRVMLELEGLPPITFTLP